jgi:hypothetical protein
VSLQRFGVAIVSRRASLTRCGYAERSLRALRHLVRMHQRLAGTLLGAPQATPGVLSHNRPQTNGKAERFIRTLLSGWAYSGAVYASSAQRTAALDGWLYHSNHHRRHQALGRQTPITRLNNLLGSYS